MENCITDGEKTLVVLSGWVDWFEGNYTYCDGCGKELSPKKDELFFSIDGYPFCVNCIDRAEEFVIENEISIRNCVSNLNIVDFI